MIEELGEKQPSSFLSLPNLNILLFKLNIGFIKEQC